MNDEKLCIRIQRKGDRWIWELCYPRGLVYASAEASTLADASAAAGAALDLAERKLR